MTTSETDGRHDVRTMRLARMGVVGTLLSTALLCLAAGVYILVWQSPVGVGAAVVICLLGISADIAVRRTWNRVEGGVRNPGRRQRLLTAAEVAGMSPQRVAWLERSLTVLWFVVLGVAFLTAKGAA